MSAAEGRDDKNFREGTPPVDHGFFLKGSGQYDWGMKNRLARIFRPATGRTVMLAFDHGYFQGPTTGLERVDVNISVRHQGQDVHVHALQPSSRPLKVAVVDGQHHRTTGRGTEYAGQAILHAPIERAGAFEIELTGGLCGYI